MNPEDTKVEETHQSDDAAEKRLTVEVPTDVQAGIKPDPTCTCPPGCCC